MLETTARVANYATWPQR